MSDLLAEVASDKANYRRLCEFFDEPIQYEKDAYNNDVEDCYGEHAKKLDARFESTFVIQGS